MVYHKQPCDEGLERGTKREKKGDKQMRRRYRVLVCGGRNWGEREPILRELRKLIKKHGRVLVIEGEARGADKLSRKAAEELGCPCERYPAQWDRYGRGAGPIRNRQMLTEGEPDEVLAFHENIDESKGTKNMVETAAKAGVAVRVFDR